MSGRMNVRSAYHGTVNTVQARWPRVNGPFDRPEWFGLLEREGPKPLIAVAEGDDGTILAALPLSATGRTLRSMSNWFSFTWRPLLADPRIGDRALRELAGDLRRRASPLVFDRVPDEDRSASRLLDAFRAAGWIVGTEACDHNHVLPLHGRNFATYWADRPGRLRSTVRRKRKLLDVKILHTFEDDAWQSYRSIYAESWKPAEEDAQMLQRFAVAEGAAGRLRLGIAYHDNKPIAAQFWTVENDTAYIHKLAYLAAHRQLSAGTVLSAAMFEYAIDIDRVALIDYGTGDDAYKRDWTEIDRPRYRIECVNPLAMAAWPNLAALLLRSARRRLRGERVLRKGGALVRGS